MSAQALEAIARRLAEVLGTEVRAVETQRLRSMVDVRCRALELQDAEEYLRALADDPAEMDALIDAAVVRETRFFRDAAVFEHIRAAVPALAVAFGGTLRVLSAPCSTGQEAYSLAATLVSAGLPPERFMVDAFDISPAALAAARGGVYPEGAVRGLREDLRGSLGRLGVDGFCVDAGLRGRVRFSRRNLALGWGLNGGNNPRCDGEAVVPGAPVLGAPGYHLILCRNLFIYLARPARLMLARSLAEALVPGGRLVIGTADRVEELSALFAPLKPAASFAFELRRELATPRNMPVLAAAIAKPRRVGVVLRPEPLALKVEADAPACAAALYLRALEDVRQGELRKAERRCRQSLYLDPQYLPALELLRTLWRQQPSLRLRQALEDRIARLQLGAMASGQPEETV